MTSFLQHVVDVDGAWKVAAGLDIQLVFIFQYIQCLDQLWNLLFREIFTCDAIQ